jgi:tRNA pseudouridine55 synthase
LGEAVLLSEVEDAAKTGRIDNLLRPVDALFSCYPSIRIDERQKAKCLNGTEFMVEANNGLYRVYDENAGFLMLGQVDGGMMHTVKSFFNVSI